MMECAILIKEARFITLRLNDGGLYHTSSEYKYELIPEGNDVVPFPVTMTGTTNQVITSIFGLMPDMKYKLTLIGNAEEVSLSFHTLKESVTLNVLEFGAKAKEGIDDTIAIQAAITACPSYGRVLIPSGQYHVTSLFLKSNTRIELAKGAELIGTKDPSKLPILPGTIETYDEKKKYYLGTFEGNPLSSYASLITGIDVRDCIIYGEGTLNGNAGFDDWWKIDKAHFKIARPNTVFLNHCHEVKLVGFHVTMSPMWTLHPYYSDYIDIMGVSIDNPWNSPNTDGLDPESCTQMRIMGVRFSLGDDCIAIKAGKIYMAKNNWAPTADIVIAHCLMEKGHGAVTIGSEIACGVRGVLVEKCLFRETDRGLRIKTRRGRGEDSILDDIQFHHIKMENVVTPFVVNSFYFCDPDGKTDYVQNRENLPIDDRTPKVGKLVFSDIECEGAEVAAGYYLGLPEQPIEEIYMKDIKVTYKEDIEGGMPAMALYVPEMKKAGIYAENVKKLVLDHVEIKGQIGEKIVAAHTGVEEVE